MKSEKLVGDAFDRARDRGEKIKEEIALEPDMLTAEEVSKIIGMSVSIVGVCRDNGGLIGLPTMDGYCYPKWQFDKKNGVVVKGIRDILAVCDKDVWMTYRYLIEIYPDEKGDTVYEKLRQGHVELVLNHINATLAGVFT